MLATVGAIPANAQFVREYKIAEKKHIDLVKLSFTSYKSLTQLRRVKTQEPLYIHGHLAQSNILPDFRYSETKNILEASLVHRNVEPTNLGKSITSKLFFSETDFEHTWDIGLVTNYLYELDFNLGMGKAYFDLSQIPVSNLKIKSASADVSIGYGSDTPNQVAMDTLLVTLNMGTVQIQDANFTNAKKIILEVNYGKVELDFSEGKSLASQVIAAVGGGSIFVKLPPESNPIKIKMKTTPMCRTTLPKYLKAIDDETYVSKGYTPSNGLVLVLDVGVGSITVE
jgi:hypothetical protein